MKKQYAYNATEWEREQARVEEARNAKFGTVNRHVVHLRDYTTDLLRAENNARIAEMRRGRA